MDLSFLTEDEQLSYLSSNLHQSPEEFLSELEDRLDSGEITLTEAHQLIQDYQAMT